ncbi:MAG: DNA polymerase III subunit tau [Chloroflexi bacterium ADurb.Bin325]|nr:MAG: DNA polymerase III subunit tau [Chloroflexi bacterium ADurb.Bin325]
MCERGEGPPCGVCLPCRRVAEGRYPDVQLIRAEKNTIQIDQVRSLQADAAIAPLEGRRKVFIIREIERATPPAANALLKTLEEPAPHVVLLLTSNRRDQVLPTILSRCQVMGLRPMPLDQLQAALETRWGLDEERARLLARLSAGRLGWAVTAHTDPELWERRTGRLDDLLGLVAGNAIARLAYAEKLSRADDVEAVLGLWATWWRDVLLVQQHIPEAVLNLDRKPQLLQQAELFGAEQVQSALADLVQTLHRIRANVNLRLALDVLLLRLPKPAVA